MRFCNYVVSKIILVQRDIPGHVEATIYNSTTLPVLHKIDGPLGFQFIHTFLSTRPPNTDRTRYGQLASCAHEDIFVCNDGSL